MKQKRIRHGWLRVLFLIWIVTGSLSAEDNSTRLHSGPGSPQVQTNEKPPITSAASQKIYGLKSESDQVIESKPVGLLEVMLRIFGALLIVLAILLGGAWWFRNSRMFGLMPAQSSHLDVIETRSLGSRHSLHVVEYGSKRFLIADSPAGTNYLTDLDKLDESFEQTAEESGENTSGSFADKLKSLLERKG